MRRAGDHDLPERTVEETLRRDAPVQATTGSRAGSEDPLALASGVLDAFPEAGWQAVQGQSVGYASSQPARPAPGSPGPQRNAIRRVTVRNGER